MHIPEGKNYYQRGRRKDIDPKAFKWVMFPNGNHYALTKYLDLKYSPVVDEQGNIVDVDFGTISPVVSKAVEDFMGALKSPKEDNAYEGEEVRKLVLSLTRVLKALLEPQYEWTPEDWQQMLTFEPQQYGYLLGVVLQHIYGA